MGSNEEQQNLYDSVYAKGNEKNSLEDKLNNPEFVNSDDEIKDTNNFSYIQVNSNSNNESGSNINNSNISKRTTTNTKNQRKQHIRNKCITKFVKGMSNFMEYSCSLRHYKLEEVNILKLLGTNVIDNQNFFNSSLIDILSKNENIVIIFYWIIYNINIFKNYSSKENKGNE